MTLLLATATVLVTPTVLMGQREVVGHHVMLSDASTSVSFALADGESRLITLGNGRVMVDGSDVATYETGSAFEASWLRFIAGQTSTGTVELLEGLQEWAERSVLEVRQTSRASAGAEYTALLEAVMDLRAVPLPEPAIAVGSGSNVERIEFVMPEIPDIPAIQIPDIVVSAEVPSVRFVPPEALVGTSPSIVGSIGTGLASLVASLVAMSLMGFGFLIFAPRQLRAVSDTVWSSFGKSFLAGMFAQPLLLPVFGALLVALTLTVVGVLLIPVAIPLFALAVFLSVSGGYLAIARGVGEVYLRRRNHGITPTEPWAEMKFLWYGLIGLLAIWLPAVLLGWIPVVGPVFTILAAIITWVLATAGFGASIISRGGIRGTVMRRLDRALSEGDYWTDTGSFRTVDRSMSGI